MIMRTLKIQKKTYEKLQEHKKNLEEELQNVLIELNNAREKGDLRENAEYTSAKSKKHDLEKEITDITYRLLNSTIVEDIILKEVVTFGNTIIIEDQKIKRESIYTILGEEEADISEGKISCDSLLGRNILGKRKGDIFSIETPNGLKTFLLKDFFIKKEND